MRYVEVEPGRVWLSEGDPHGAPAPGQVRVRVAACGLCASDAHMVRGMRLPRGVSYPVRPGHEVAGTVIEVGPGAIKRLPRLMKPDARLVPPHAVNGQVARHPEYIGAGVNGRLGRR